VAGNGTAKYQLVLDKEAFESALDQVSDKVKEFFGQFTAGAAAGAFFLGLEQQAESVKAAFAELPGQIEELTSASAEYSKTLEDLNIRTGESVEGLQNLAAAGGLAGLSLDSTSLAVTRMEKAIETGSKGFALLGTSAADFQGMAPDQAFDKLSAAIMSVEDPMKRAAAAQTIFGRAGAQLLPIMAQDMADVAARAQALGIIVPESIQEAAASFQTSMNLLGETEQGLARNVGDIFASDPHVQDFIDAFTEQVGKLSKSIQDNTSVFQGLIDPFVNTGNAALQAADDVEELASAVGHLTGVSGLDVLGSILGIGSSVAGTAGSAVHMPGLDLVGEFQEATTAAQALEAVLEAIHDTLSMIAVASGDGGIPGVRKKSGSGSIFDAPVPSLPGAAMSPADAMALMNKDQGAADKETQQFLSAQKELADATAALTGGLDGEIAKIEADTAYKVAAVKGTDSLSESTRSLLEQVGQVREVEAWNKAWGQAAQSVAQAAAASRSVLESWAGAFGGGGQGDMTDFGELTEKLRLASGGQGLAGLDPTQFENYGQQLGKVLADGIANGVTTDMGGGQGDAIEKAYQDFLDQRKTNLFASGQAQNIGTGGLWSADPQVIQQEADNVKHLGDNADDARSKMEALLNVSTNLKGLAGDFSALGSLLKDVGAGQGIQSVVSGLGGLAGAGASFATSMASGNIFGMISSGLQGVGSVVNIFKSLFGGESEQQKVADDLGTKFGKTFSDSLTKAIADTETKDNVSRALAEDLNISSIMTEGGGDPSQYLSQITDLMGALHDGTVPEKDAVDQLNKAFDDLKTSADAGSTASLQAMIAMQKQATALGESIPDMTKAIAADLKTATTGLDAFFQGLADLPDVVGKSGALTSGGQGTTSLTQGAANEQILGSLYNTLAATEGAAQAALDLGTSFTDLQKTLPKGVAVGGDYANAMQMLTLMNNQTFKGAATGAAGLGQTAQGVIEAGGLTQAFTNALGTSAQTLYLQEMSVKGATTATALEGELPLLKELAQAQALGMKLDPAAAKLVADATKDGLLPAQDVATQSLGQLKVIAQNTGRMGAGGGGPTYNVPGLAEGGYITAPTLAVLHGREAVMPLDSIAPMLRSILGAAPGPVGASAAAPVTIEVSHAPMIHVEMKAPLGSESESAAWVTQVVGNAMHLSNSDLMKQFRDAVNRVLQGG